MRTNGRSGQTSVVVAGAVAIVVASVTLLSLLDRPNPLVGLQLALAVLLVVVAVVTEIRVYASIPWLARPSVAICGSTLIASIAVDQMSTSDYARYLTLWATLVAGMIVASFVSGRAQRQQDPRPESIDIRKQDQLGILMLVVALLAAIAFFATQGVPALSGNVEQGRVDAAVEGTGYFRLVAYMSGPATIMLFVTKSRYRFLALVVTLLIITGMANRSPYLYLFVPLIFVWATRSRIKLTTPKILLAAVAVGALVIGFGTFRVVSQDEFAKYAEYSDALAHGDYFAVALTSLTNYAQVVPENQVLTSKLVDSGALPFQWGSSYVTLFISALPGEQLSLDRQIREASGSSFVGGGTPPTLAGEGYVNFGLIGTFAAGMFVVGLLRYWARRFDGAERSSADSEVVRGYAAVYGYVLCWVVGAPVAGLAGASTVPLAGLILLILLRSSGRRRTTK